jgi:hypothetical protein
VLDGEAAQMAAATQTQSTAIDEEAATVERLCARIRLLETALDDLVTETWQRQHRLTPGSALALAAALDVLNPGRPRTSAEPVPRTATR